VTEVATMKSTHDALHTTRNTLDSDSDPFPCPILVCIVPCVPCVPCVPWRNRYLGSMCGHARRVPPLRVRGTKIDPDPDTDTDTEPDPYTHSLTHLFDPDPDPDPDADPDSYILTHSLTHSLTHLLTHLLTHSLTHILTHILTCIVFDTIVLYFDRTASVIGSPVL
jgi:hypothetical protein